LTLAGVAAMHALSGLLIVLFAPVPDVASWIFILASTLIHYAYYVLLFQAYRLGDLSLVYPIARGLAPAMVAASAWLVLGESLGTVGWLGLACVTCGIAVLAYRRRIAREVSGRAVTVAAILGVSIAAYSVADGIGVRSTANPLSYIGWLFLLEFPVPLWIALKRRNGGTPDWQRTVAIGLAGGLISVVAYGLVLYAKTIAPLGAVSAVRESSVIIAALIGLVVFGERPLGRRLIAAGIVAAGVAALAFGT
jgi:drug/metabolite transporter (DMT)-like permease